MTAQILENENANLRIKALLAEFMNPEYEIENVRPYSPSQQKKSLSGFMKIRFTCRRPIA